MLCDLNVDIMHVLSFVNHLFSGTMADRAFKLPSILLMAVFFYFTAADGSTLSSHDNAVMHLAKTIKSIEQLLQDSNTHLKKISSSPHLIHPSERGEIDPTLLRPARPIKTPRPTDKTVHSLGARSFGSIGNPMEKRLDSFPPPYYSPPFDGRPGHFPPPNYRFKRPAEDDTVLPKSRDTGDEVLDVINSMMKRRFNDENSNVNTNVNKNDNTIDVLSSESNEDIHQYDEQ